MSRLTVAVVIPTIPGREELLQRAVLSVHSQTRVPDQLVVERDSERTGAWSARNQALTRVRTDVVAWLDDDDTLQPNHLRACMRVMENSPFRPGLVYPRPRMIGGPDPTAVTYQGIFPTSPWGLRWTEEFTWHMRNRGSFVPMTHLVRTEHVRAAGGFRPGYMVNTDGRDRYRGEDEDYLLHLLDLGVTFEHLDAKTWNWHVHAGNTAGRGA